MKNMGDGRRQARVEKEIQNVIAQFLIQGFKGSLPGLVTVASVRMPADFRTAKVYISVLGSENDQERAIEVLQERAYEVQNFIGRELRMRYCPRLTFYLDHATGEILNVERILHELEEERQAKNSGMPEKKSITLKVVESDSDDE